jgi:predicted HTH transcriptional regulator
MANLPGGGVIIIGVNEGANHAIDAVGLNDADLLSWNFDDVAAGINASADPRVSFDLEVVPQEERRFVILTIQEFDNIPVLCSRDASNQAEVILRKGALYVRGHGKPETSEVASQTAMREVLDLAIDKGVRTFMARVYRANVLVPPALLPAQPADADQFQAELEDPNA